MRDLLYGAPGHWSFRRCPRESCGLAWLDPLPEPEEVPRLYQRYYTHAGTAPSRVSVRDALYRLYRCAQGAAARLTGLHRDWKLLESGGLDGRPAGRLLDVGCGDGRFLESMHRKGWEVMGCEVDAAAAAAATARGLTVRVGQFATLHWPASSFDAVTLQHVLEHLPHPSPAFQTAWRILRPGGLLVMVTPNVDSLGQQIFGRAWRGWEPPRHFCLYRPALLRLLAEQNGFHVLQCRSSAARADVILGASMSIREARGETVPDPPPISIGRTLRAVALQYREHFLVRHGRPVGEECLLICRKPE